MRIGDLAGMPGSRQGVAIGVFTEAGVMADPPRHALPPCGVSFARVAHLIPPRLFIRCLQKRHDEHTPKYSSRRASRESGKRSLPIHKRNFLTNSRATQKKFWKIFSSLVIRPASG
jgi:hypothetical protein